MFVFNGRRHMSHRSLEVDMDLSSEPDKDLVLNFTDQGLPKIQFDITWKKWDSMVKTARILRESEVQRERPK